MAVAATFLAEAGNIVQFGQQTCDSSQAVKHKIIKR
jgi:hypothetical protein